ncbi:unnamed protein product, partial [Allacma fusca]
MIRYVRDVTLPITDLGSDKDGLRLLPFISEF